VAASSGLPIFCKVKPSLMGATTTLMFSSPAGQAGKSRAGRGRTGRGRAGGWQQSARVQRRCPKGCLPASHVTCCSSSPTQLLLAPVLPAGPKAAVGSAAPCCRIRSRRNVGRSSAASRSTLAAYRLYSVWSASHDAGYKKV
jgi:hypothetical protein